MAARRRGPGSLLGISESASKRRKREQDKTHQQKVHRINLADAFDEFQTLRQRCGFANSRPAEFIKHLMTVHKSCSLCTRVPTSSSSTRDQDQGSSRPEYSDTSSSTTTTSPSICSPPDLTCSTTSDQDSAIMAVLPLLLASTPISTKRLFGLLSPDTNSERVHQPSPQDHLNINKMEQPNSSPQNTIESAEPPNEKQPAPKKTAKAPKKPPSREPVGLPRNRRHPRKVVTEFKKKILKARVARVRTTCERPPKQYIRVEVKRLRLPKVYECKTCFQHLPKPEDVRNHFLEMHQQEKSLSPPQDKSAETSATNPSHRGLDLECTLLPDITNLANLLRQCPKCQKFVDNIIGHKCEHRERNFLCEECGKGFTDYQNLQKHKKVHEMDRMGDPYKCKLCDKSYRFLQALHNHMKHHSSEKTFICDHCGKSFYTKNRLIIHSAIHMKEKPYKCDECGRGFTQLFNLRCHQRKHTGVKPYRCELCQDSFTHKVSLKTHQKKKHGIDWWKENGIWVEEMEEKSCHKKGTHKRAAAKGTVEKKCADMKTLVNQQRSNGDVAVRNYGDSFVAFISGTT